MKFIFDCRYTRIGRHDGISRYTAGVVEAFSRLHPVTMLISDARQLDMLPDLPWIMGSDPTSLTEPWIARTVNRARPDVVFSPMQTMGSLGRRYKLILTLHDLIYYNNPTPPRDLPWFIRLGWRIYHLAYWPQRLVLNRADAIVTGTEAAKAQILERRLTTRPITVVSSAVDPAPKRRTAERDRTLVYMGSFMPYKNVESLAAALRDLPGYRLQLLSRISDRDRARYSALAPDGAIEFLNGVTDEEYARLLSRATALVTASFEEGFGIPVIEALAMGTPVVCSDIPVFREVAGPGAVYFDPHDPSDIARAVLSLDDDEVWQRLSSAGPGHAANYTWDRSAARLLALVESLAVS
ncbi:glycosyltransferase involved in cell wall biosynthesis [Cryobacterium mesophilum]|uniref:Glycosyltransferase family 1 protein n=1 Tax=Terrimesophilobacter mesophilus TaxID=433647 RepID=A0A4R8V7T1_9MICO|nr:glycosyltransferase family 1 protein [Terrimesophilobacter mesophilus]MBB5631960.1 glycosyltransferase involved in cell wall biosynthesis [Terrimesophilobacter mesophilus]TFB78859.1 glycosyltransferase family 1 protein [Terrimesophilobacter mesophilus]